MATLPTPNSLHIRKQNFEPSSLRDQESTDPQVLSLRDLLSFWLPDPENKERSSASSFSRCVHLLLHPSVLPALLSPASNLWLSFPRICLSLPFFSQFPHFLPLPSDLPHFPQSLPPHPPPLPSSPPHPHLCCSLSFPAVSLLSLLLPSYNGLLQPLSLHLSELLSPVLSLISPIVSLSVSTSPCIFH